MHEVHVMRKHGRWEVSMDGVTRRMIDWLCTKERAVAHAEQRAREVDDGTTIILVVERSDGSEERRLAL